MMRVRSILLVPIASVAIYACSDADVAPLAPLPSGLPAGYEDVLLEGLMTSESLQSLAQALADGPLEEGASTKAIVDWPADGEALPAYPPASFCWRFGALARAAPPVPYRWVSSAPHELLPRTAPDRAVAPLLELLGPPRSAFAEGQPYTGPGTYLVFSTAAEPKLVRALTSRNAFIPTDEVWDKMAAAGAPITLTLASASFEQNRVTPYGAVMAGTTITFTIKQ
jgi:hypothetical protein